jgi:D-alanyl-lipoteichoic acid acyltransferase DltB (MBOAT superfamily)
VSPLEFVCFVTAVLLLYYLLPRKAQPYILLAAGLFYCLSVSLLCLLTLLGVTVNVYLSAIAIERRRSRRVLAVGIALTLASLVINKFSTAFLR